MALPKPQASKAPAYVQPVGGHHSQKTSHDPCCIPAGVETGSPVNGSSSAKDDATYFGAQGALGHIVSPSAH